MHAQRARSELSYTDICSRLDIRYKGDFSTPAAAWMKLDRAFQQRKESRFQWSDRLNSIGDSIFRLDVSGKTQSSRDWSRSFALRLIIGMRGSKRWSRVFLKLWKRLKKASGGITTSRGRLITIAPNGLVPMYGDGHRKGKE